MHSRVLVVEDDTALARVLAIALRTHGYEVEVARSDEAVGAARSHPGVVLVDLGPPETGLPMVRGLRRSHGDSAIIVHSVHHERDVAEAAMAEGADDFMTKPFSVSELVQHVGAVHGRA